MYVDTQLTELRWFAVAALVIASTAHAEQAKAPTFQELMDPARFPEPQRGMVVESARLDAGYGVVRTTGADMAVDLAKGRIALAQRIGHARPLAVARLGRTLSGAKLTHTGPGFARITLAAPKLTIRINGDSLCMIHAHEPVTIEVDRKIAPSWDSSYRACHLIADEWGALGLYCSRLDLDDHYDVYADTVARYALPAGAVLWIAVCPPKPYNWERSLTDNVVWHWSNKLGYPPDKDLRRWKEHGNIVLLQSEVMLWKDWNLGFEPRLGREEFARVRKTIHDLGMRFIVYTSPFYFLKGTALEPRALNSFENFKGWPPGTPTGENRHLFLPEIRKVMRELKPDGLYFDGQYTRNPAALYALAREARAIVGEDGILEWHSTTALGSDHCYLPQADAYVDFILRGEGRGRHYANIDYLRFFVSGYHIHNSIGVICNNGKIGVTAKMVDDVLRVNARFHTIAGWLDNPKIMTLINDRYKPALTPPLRGRVEAFLAERQAQVERKAAAMRAEIRSLRKPFAETEPLASFHLDTMPEGTSLVSERNPDALTISDGIFNARGHGNTYAFRRIPVSGKAQAFVVKLRQHTDHGQSWGTAAMLIWKRGGGVRLGTRSDGTLQADVLGRQVHGRVYDPKTWVWLRARWGRHQLIVERSDDGETYERLWSFAHGGVLNGPLAALLIGKVPYNGEPKDYTVPGQVGTGQIDEVRIYE